MLKKRLGIEAIEKNWDSYLYEFYKIPSLLTIPENCRALGFAAFSDCGRLKEVEIPRFMKTINYGAFKECSGLSKVVISEGVEEIGEDAFAQCWNLKKVVIPKSVERIDDHAFWGCINAEVILEKSRSEFRRIGYNAFSGCRDVKEEIRS